MMSGAWLRSLLAVAKVALWVAAGLLVVYVVQRAIAAGLLRL